MPAMQGVFLRRGAVPVSNPPRAAGIIQTARHGRVGLKYTCDKIESDCIIEDERTIHGMVTGSITIRSGGHRHRLRIVERLMQGACGAELAALTPQVAERELALLAQQIRAAVDLNAIEASRLLRGSSAGSGQAAYSLE